MSHHEDDILARELGKLGVSGAKLGGKLSGAPEFAGRLGASFGAHFAAKFLPTERHQTELKLRAEPSRVLTKLHAFFLGNGRVANDEETGESPYPKISGVIGSGFLKLNPAVVHAEIIAIENDACTLLLTAAAKEGLIKQRTAEKAVTRIVESISSLE